MREIARNNVKPPADGRTLWPVLIDGIICMLVELSTNDQRALIYAPLDGLQNPTEIIRPFIEAMANEERVAKGVCRGYLRKCIKEVQVVRTPNITRDPHQTGRLVALMIWARAVRRVTSYDINTDEGYIRSELTKLYTIVYRMREVTPCLGLEGKGITLIQ